MRRSSRRGVVLLAVLVVITLAALIGVTLLVSADAERSSAQVTLAQTQSRALAWSGVQAAMAQLSQERDALIMSQSVDLDQECVLFVDEFGREAVVRLVASRDGEFMHSEGSKLDLNHATKEMLTKLVGIGTEERAQRIIDARPFTSVEELVRIEGFPADLVYGFAKFPEALRGGGAEGPLEAGAGQSSGVDSGRSGAARSSTAAGVSPSGTPALIDLLTVFSFDPNIQVGVQDETKRGKLRLNLNVPWSDRLERAVEEQWGRDAVAIVKQIMESNAVFTNDQTLLKFLIQVQSDSAGVRNVLDSVTTSDDMFRLGRVDVLRAPVEVLVTLPGIDFGKALDIVDLRERLTDVARLSPVWLVDEGVLTMPELAEIIDFVTTRSMVWRVRIEAGYREFDPMDRVAGVAQSVLDDVARESQVDKPLTNRVMYDAVIDVSSERARVAYLREVTMLDLAHRLREREVEVLSSDPAAAYEASLMSDLGLDILEQEIQTPPAEAVAESGESRVEAARAARRAEREAARAERTMPREVRAEQNEPHPEPVRAMPGDPVDRRIGRWRNGGGN